MAKLNFLSRVGCGGCSRLVLDFLIVLNRTNKHLFMYQVHLLDFPNIVIKGSELQLPFQACLKVCFNHLLTVP